MNIGSWAGLRGFEVGVSGVIGTTNEFVGGTQRTLLVACLTPRPFGRLRAGGLGVYDGAGMAPCRAVGFVLEAFPAAGEGGQAT